MLTIAILLSVMWLLGFAVFNIATPAIHSLIVLALVAFLIAFVSDRAAQL